jgi:hypothetical protein
VVISISYLELSRYLGHQRAVYGLDDGYLLSAADFDFSSIMDVAETCVTSIKQACQEHLERLVRSDSASSVNEMRIVLAGWSYGGVVAAELGVLLTSHPLKVLDTRSDVVKEILVVVDELFLFDSPIRSAVVSHARSLEGTGADKDLARRSSEHFALCTTLLESHYRSSVARDQKRQLVCAIHDFRPAGERTPAEMIISVQELTTGPIFQYTLPGTHWTIVYGENAVSIADSLLGQGVTK